MVSSDVSLPVSPAFLLDPMVLKDRDCLSQIL